MLPLPKFPIEGTVDVENPARDAVRAGGARSAARAEPPPPSEAVSPSSGVAAQRSGAEEAKPRGQPAASDPGLDSLRGLLDQARQAKKDKDFAGARTKIASAIEKTLAEIGYREDAAALVILKDMRSLAHAAGEL